ncbi:MAG TPA: PLP-dependent aminotransferase family protein [Aliidongia sp.]|uniref:MocR-like pyridoxine biosynthesis transcription factor PdxR n=1 Tax=Aliidongia sp. TaxID=1914230 RepID=UPI002DDD0822|nr:PLP-dependent aminotransferase family protein [Aliidongia sp.]HEV2675137.1 PLP-dependent aminotransferase family protein [Aliidongia sp.]
MVKREGGALLLSIVIDRRSPRPIGTQLYMAVRDLMLAGAIAPGARLPASRTLARDLGLSRTTVIDAFDRLIAEGLVEARVGSGAFVSTVLNAERPRRAPIEAPPALPHKAHLSETMRWAVDRFSERSRLPHAPRAFVTALPAFDVFPMAQWARLAAKHWRGDRESVMGYGAPFGYAPLREAVAAHLRANRGIACEQAQIFIVGGAQQAFHLIGSVLLNPGDKVWFENPGAIGARNSLLASGADLVPVPVDSEGLRVDEGLRRSPDFRLAFVTPSHHQPLGHVMSLERRFALLRSAEQAGAWIIEDDYDGEFFFGRRPPPTLKSVDRTGLVIYVGTFSKSLFPALRLGFMLVPPSLVETFERVSAAFVQGVPTSNQAIVADFIEEGHFATHIRRMRRIYEERHDTLCDAAARDLGDLLQVMRSDSGLHTIGLLRRDLSEIAVARAAAERDITVSPIARFSIEPIALKGLVLGFGGIPPAVIRRGVALLGEVLRDQARRRP